MSMAVPSRNGESMAIGVDQASRATLDNMASRTYRITLDGGRVTFLLARSLAEAYRTGERLWGPVQYVQARDRPARDAPASPEYRGPRRAYGPADPPNTRSIT
jgi:hypothetical protein